MPTWSRLRGCLWSSMPAMLMRSKTRPWLYLRKLSKKLYTQIYQWMNVKFSSLCWFSINKFPDSYHLFYQSILCCWKTKVKASVVDSAFAVSIVQGALTHILIILDQASKDIYTLNRRLKEAKKLIFRDRDTS